MEFYSFSIKSIKNLCSARNLFLVELQRYFASFVQITIRDIFNFCNYGKSAITMMSVFLFISTKKWKIYVNLKQKCNA